MSYSKVLYNGNGVVTNFSVPFSYLDRTHVSATVNGVSTPITFLTDFTVQITPAPTGVVQIRRITPKDAVPVNFSDGSVLREADLDLLATFTLYCAQEAQDVADGAVGINTLGQWDGQGHSTTNFAAPTTQSGLVTKGYMDDTFIPAIAGYAATASSASASAQGYATLADDSADLAVAALSSFRGQYLGAKTSDPTLDGNGAALTAGDLYLNTTQGAMKVFTGSVWINAGSTVQGTINKPETAVIATAGQTSVPVPGGYDPGFIVVFLNGSQVMSPDITATSGSAIVFTTPLALNDEVSWIAFGSFNVANATPADGSVTVAKLSSAVLSLFTKVTDLAASTGAGLVGFIQSLTGAVLRSVSSKLSDNVSVFDFMTAAQIADVKAKTFGFDVTAACQAALNTGANVQFPAGAYKITAPLTMAVGGGIYGDGEKTILIRFFNGGPMVRHPGGTNVGDPILLRDFAINTDVSITPGNGDTGVDIGYSVAWGGRGDISNVIIIRQWDGFKWKGGTVNPIRNVQVYDGLGHGFYGVNPRGELNGCLAQYNKGNGYYVLAANTGETGVRLIQCGTFCNQEFGLLLDASVGVSSANIWMEKFSSSYDGRGGIYCDKTYTQLQFNDTFVEYAGWSTQFKPAFTSYPAAAGITFSTNVTFSQLSGITQVLHNKGAGMTLDGTTDVTIEELISYDNGRGVQGGASQNGMNIQNNTRLRLKGFSRGPGGANQLYDIAVNTTNNTGELDNLRASAVYDAGSAQLVWPSLVSGLPSATAASASTLVLPSYSDLITVTGVTTVDAIAVSWTGRRVTLKFTGALTVSDGNNIKLFGAFITTADDMLSLVYDGGFWVETGRSVN